MIDGFRLNFLGDEESGQRAFATKKEFQVQFKGTGAPLLADRESGIFVDWLLTVRNRVLEEGG